MIGLIERSVDSFKLEESTRQLTANLTKEVSPDAEIQRISSSYHQHTIAITETTEDGDITITEEDISSPELSSIKDEEAEQYKQSIQKNILEKVEDYLTIIYLMSTRRNPIESDFQKAKTYLDSLNLSQHSPLLPFIGRIKNLFENTDLDDPVSVKDFISEVEELFAAE